MAKRINENLFGYFDAGLILRQKHQRNFDKDIRRLVENLFKKLFIAHNKYYNFANFI